MPTAGSQFSRYKIPAEVNPVGICCISVPVPNDREWIAQFMGAIWRMSIQSHYERDDAKSGTVVAARWRDIWKEIQVACCAQSPSVINIQISNQLVINMQLAVTWRQIWIDATSVVSIAYYAIPDTFSTDAGDTGDEVFQREQALCLAVQGWVHEVMNYMEAWMLGNIEDIAVVFGGSFTATVAIPGLLMWPVLIGWAVSALVALDVFLELRRTEYREYIICRMLENLKGLDPDSRSDFESALTADPIGRPQPEDALQDAARDLIEAYLRSQLNNLDNYLMFAGQLGTAMDIARSGSVDCPCLVFEHTFDFTIDAQGWTAFVLGGDTRAAYDAGVGWGNFAQPDPFDHLIQIEHPAFSSRFITLIQFTIDTVMISPGSAMSLRMPDVGGAQFASGVSPNGDLVKELAVNADGTGLWVSVNQAGSTTYPGHLTKLVISGRGADPF